MEAARKYGATDFISYKNGPIDEQVLALYKSLVHEVNKSLSNRERLRHFRLVADQWTTEGGELTPTLKIQRRRSTEKFAGLIADI